MSDKFDKFTERARKVLTLAQEEAQRFNHNYIGTEHLLLGLVREGDGVAARVLSNMGVQLPKVRSAVEFIIGRGETMVMGEIGLTPRAKKVIELAVDEARRLNHHYIGTEHLLLGLVREGEGIAAGVLESLGVNLEKVRAQVMQVVSQSPSYSQSKQQTKTPYMDALGVDLTEAARTGKLGPLIGRSTEIDRVMQILSRRTKNNPALIGEPGVGKTAIVEGLGAADHQRRRSRAAAEQAADRARYWRAGCRHQVPGRVRRAAEEDRRRGQGDRQHPLHRRAAHAGRRRSRRRGGRCRQHPQARAFAGRAADDRRDDPRRVPQVHRAGRGAGAAIPAGPGRRAERRRDHPDPDRRPLAL